VSRAAIAAPSPVAHACSSDRLVVEITQEPGHSFLDRMISLVEGAERRKTPNEIALNILLAALTLIFLLVIVALRPYALFANTTVSVTTLIALLVALIPTTIGALLSAIGIAGMDRLVRRNVLALSGRAVEASGDVDVLLLDKTGTITLGNRQASEFIPDAGRRRGGPRRGRTAFLARRRDPGGPLDRRARQAVRDPRARSREQRRAVRSISATTRMSGVDLDGQQLRKGAGDAIIDFVKHEGGQAPPELAVQLDRIGREGGTPLAVARNSQILGVVYLKDTIKLGMRERFDSCARWDLDGHDHR